MTMARVKAAPKTTTVVYRGDVEALIGRKFEVPLGVSNMRQWIEENHKPAPKPEPVAEPEVVIEAAPKPAPAPPVTRQMNHAERLDLADAVRESGAAIVGCEERINAKVHDWDQRHEAVVQQNEATAQAAQEQTQTAVETTEQSKAELQQALSEERNLTQQLRTELDAYVRSDACKGDKGERGKRGIPGSGFGYCNVNPSEVDIESLGERFFGRAVVPGDYLFRRTKTALLVYRTADGVSWEQIDEILNELHLVSQPVSVLDQSVPQYTTIVQTGTGSGAGGGGEKLLTDSATRSSTVTVADTSNWTAAGHENPKSGTLFVEVADAVSGDRGSIHASIVTGNNVGDTRITEFALLGTLFEKGTASPDVDIDATPGNAVVPPGLTGVTSVPGATRTLVTIRIGANLGSGGPYILSGMVFWNQRAEGRAVDLKQATPQPAWIWA